MVDERKIDGLKYTSFTDDVMFIRGGTLERFLHDPELSKKEPHGYEWFWVYEPTEPMLEIQCDDCTKRHNPKNLNCSATMGVLSDASNPNILYPFHNILDRSGQKTNVRLNYVDYSRMRIRGCVVKLGLP
jgi:hypothetical protein